jgi:twitching motility protein PilT
MTGSRDGMVTLEQSLSTLVQSNTVTLDDATARSLFPKDIEVRPRVSAGV